MRSRLLQLVCLASLKHIWLHEREHWYRSVCKRLSIRIERFYA